MKQTILALTALLFTLAACEPEKPSMKGVVSDTILGYESPAHTVIKHYRNGIKLGKAVIDTVFESNGEFTVCCDQNGNDFESDDVLEGTLVGFTDSRLTLSQGTAHFYATYDFASGRAKWVEEDLTAHMDEEVAAEPAEDEEDYLYQELEKCRRFLNGTDLVFEKYAQELMGRGEFSNEKIQEARACKTKKFYKKFQFTDQRDGQTYNAVKMSNLMGGRIWMAENLNFVTEDSWCYDNDPAMCQKYGRLYTWDAAMRACPNGWRLPSRDDWIDLLLGDVIIIDIQLKAADWEGEDTFGFSALPGGSRNSDGSFSNAGSDGYWWSASENASNPSNAYYRDMYYYNAYADWRNLSKSYGFSVRCVKD